MRSLSARRAWIEIAQSVPALGDCVVALRKESVDRNFCPFGGTNYDVVALRKESVDRNIRLYAGQDGGAIVALRKESVDRNASWAGRGFPVICRSPQGERG